MTHVVAAADRRTDDTGAVAILVVLFVVLIALPASALGLTVFVRAGALAELQQTADAAALAGASTIPLASPSYARTYATGLVEEATDQSLPPVLDENGVAVEPLANACRQAQLSARGRGFAGAWSLPITEPPPNNDGYVKACDKDPEAGPGDPASADGFAGVKYFRDDSILRSLGSCVDTLLASVPVPVPGAPEPVPPLPGTAGSVIAGLAAALPALLYPGVVVQTRQRVQGPLDELLRPGSEARLQVATARARRRVKNVVVLPVATVAGSRISTEDDVIRTTREAKQALADIGAFLTDPRGTLEPVLPTAVPLPTPLPTTGTVLDDALPSSIPLAPLPSPTGPSALPSVSATVPVPGPSPTSLEVGVPSIPIPGVPGGLPAECGARILQALSDDYDDAIQPEDNPRDQREIIEDAAAGREPLLVLLTGPGPTLYDTLPVCFGPQPFQATATADAADTDGDGRPDSVDSEVVVRLALDSDQLVAGTRCAPGAPGAFRASLVRE